MIILLLLTLLCSSVPAMAGAEVDFSAALRLRCSSFELGKSLCREWDREVQASLGSNYSMRAMMWTRQESVRRKAQQVERRAKAQLQRGSSGKRMADLGLGQVLSGRVGEGMQTLLVVWQKSPQLVGAADAAYLAYKIIVAKLEPVQRADWAANLAARLGSVLELAEGELRMPGQGSGVPDRTMMTRLAALYMFAEDWRAADFYLGHARRLYPEDSLLIALEAQLREKATKKPPAKKKLRRRRSKYR